MNSEQLTMNSEQSRDAKFYVPPKSPKSLKSPVKLDRDIITCDIFGILFFSLTLTAGTAGVLLGHTRQLYIMGASLIMILLCYREFKLLTDKKQKQ